MPKSVNRIGCPSTLGPRLAVVALPVAVRYTETQNAPSLKAKGRRKPYREPLFPFFPPR